MAKKSEWDFALKAVEADEEAAVVKPGRVARERTLQDVHGFISCISCCADVEASHFICPECGGSTRDRKEANSQVKGKCWECKQPIGISAKACPHCGANQQVLTSAFTGMLKLGLLMAFLLVLVVVLVRVAM